MRRGRDFLSGFIIGAGLTLVSAGTVLWFVTTAGILETEASRLASISGWLDWTRRNLGASVPVFAALLIAYFATLARLRRRLDEAKPVNEIVQLDHLTDIWTTLFFGTGVIWTAIGMRSALIFALGDREAAVSQGAFAMLERMVDGGILLALSTTIFGGIGGYLMRVYKTVSLGADLQARYDSAARADTSEMRATLSRIEGHLRPRLEDSAHRGASG